MSCTISAAAIRDWLARMQVKNSSGEDTREGVEVGECCRCRQLKAF